MYDTGIEVDVLKVRSSTCVLEEIFNSLFFLAYEREENDTGYS